MRRNIMKMLMAVGLMACVLSGCAKQPAKETAEPVTVRVGSMKGPTSIGLVHLMEESEQKNANNNYRFTMEASADALLPLMIQGELDIALVPANVASVLYNKTEGGITVIDINTLGVLYMVSADESLTDIQDLAGRTIYLTGKGTTPDYVLSYILEKNGLSKDEVTLEYKTEATEVAAILAAEPESIGLLPQPFVTAACAQNTDLKIVFDMTKEWDDLQDGSRLVTGVTVVRNEFLKENEEAVQVFLQEHKESAAYVNENVENAAVLVVKQGIIEKEKVAQAAIPHCNITHIDGEEMKQTLSGYLSVLAEQNPESVGGSLPADDFYYIPAKDETK